MLKENVKNERKDYLDPTLDKYLRELDIRLGVKAEERREGRLEGRNEVKREVTKNLINLNYDYDFISKVTGLTINEIKKLKEN